MCEKDLSSCSCRAVGKNQGKASKGAATAKHKFWTSAAGGPALNHTLHHQCRAGKADPLPKENTSDQKKAGGFYFDSLYYVVYPCFVLFCCIVDFQ